MRPHSQGLTLLNLKFKVPTGIYGRAVDRKCLNEVIFFLQSKMILPSHGYVKSDEMTKVLSQLGGRSKTYRMMGRLLRLNLVRKNRKGYTLVSFDKFCTVFGYDLQVTETHRNRARRGKFKVHRIPYQLVPIKLMKEFLAALELKDNIKSQIRAVYSKLSVDPRFKYNEPARRSVGLKDMELNISEAFQDLDTVQMIKDNYEAIEEKKYFEATGKGECKIVNPDVAISCQGLGNLLNVSKTTAWNILVRLRGLGWIKWTRRWVYHKVFCPVKDKDYDDRMFYIYDGTMYWKIPNKIDIMSWLEFRGSSYKDNPYLF